MNLPLRLVFVLGVFFALPGFGQQAATSWILNRMQAHSPSSLHLLKSYDQLPSELVIERGNEIISTSKSTGTFEFLETENYSNALESMSTNVHEIGHVYGGLMHFAELMNCNCEQTIHFGDIQQGFYHSQTEEFWIEIKQEYIFPSKELAASIPYSLRTFRYDTYIEGTSSTQGNGVIGLLDEFNAYYLGSKYTFEMLPVYKELYGSNYLNKWVMHSASEMTAFFEFDFFIKEYLLFAKKNSPETYNYLKNSIGFTTAYQKIYSKYKQLIDNYSSKVEYERNFSTMDYSSEFMEEDFKKLQKKLESGAYSIIEIDFLK